MKFWTSDIKKLLSPKGRKFFAFIYKTAGYIPCDISLFETALTHRSAAFAQHKNNNERLEYLGDAVLDMLVAEILYTDYPEAREGQMTQLRATLVSRKHLNEVAKKMSFYPNIRFRAIHGLNNTHIPGDALEAFVAAIYLDGGLKRARRFVRKNIANDEQIAHFQRNSNEENFKSKLIEWGQQQHLEVIFSTRLMAEEGKPDPLFYTEAIIDGHNVAKGEGTSKKQAEQNAAYAALLEVNKIFPSNN